MIVAWLIPAVAAGVLAMGSAAGLPAMAADVSSAAATVGDPKAVDAIRAAAAAYRAALEKGDAAAIRRAWTADGDVVDGWGNLLAAADVTNPQARTDGGPRPELRVGETRLRLITPDVALEDGAVDVIIPGTTAPLEGWFSAIWVKQGGEWKLAGIREGERPPAVGADTLDDLGWMVGEWTLVPEDGDAKDAMPAMEMSVNWDAGHMFLVRDVRLTTPRTAADQVSVDVQQRIGWDPLVGRIRSWSFATDGTRGEATWFRDGNSWIARVTTVLPDGTQSTAVHIYSYEGQDRCEWRTMQEPFAPDDMIPVRATWVRKPKGGAR
jgi:ketosteroid isomerase-like protein